MEKLPFLAGVLGESEVAPVIGTPRNPLDERLNATNIRSIVFLCRSRNKHSKSSGGIKINRGTLHFSILYLKVLRLKDSVARIPISDPKKQ